MKKLIPIIIALVVVGGGGFFGGMKYGESKNPVAKFSTEQRQQMMQGNVGEGFRQTIGAGGRGILMAGEVIAKDEQSITLKTSDGSSRIIFFSDSTEISRMAAGSINDVEIGKQITITGQPNPDGSYTAKTIQLSPRYPTPNK